MEAAFAPGVTELKVGLLEQSESKFFYPLAVLLKQSIKY